MGRRSSTGVLRGALLAGSLALSHCDLAHESCFVAGTLVATPGGPRPIEALAVGDEVWAAGPGAGGLVARRVVALHRALVRETRSIRAGRLAVRGVTPSHPVYSPTRGAFVPAGGLRVGETLLGLEGAGVAPVAVASLGADERPVADAVVYNLTVEGPEHTYFADGVLVHNKGYGRVECPPVDPAAVVRPEGPLPPGTRSYTVEVDYGPRGPIEADRICASITHPAGVSQAPTFGPLTSDDGGHRWSFEVRGLEPAGPYVVDCWVAEPRCAGGAAHAFSLSLEVAP